MDIEKQKEIALTLIQTYQWKISVEECHRNIRDYSLINTPIGVRLAIKYGVEYFLIERPGVSQTDYPCHQLLGFDHKVDGKIESLSRSWDVLQCLDKFYGIKFKCKMNGGNIVAHKPKHQEVFWILTDNGGEINVELLNSTQMVKSVPSTSDKFYVTSETIAYRIMCAITDQPIDWNLRIETILTLNEYLKYGNY
jgi:hypothetical protein